MLLLAVGAAGLLHAQPVPKPAKETAPPPAPAPVGAAEIFSALTQPDRPAELEALHALRDALNGSPDPARLAAARDQLATVLQAEERHQADMPPALVMSGIASRIEAAMTALDQARHAPPAPPAPLLPQRLQAYAVPGLAGVSMALGVALLAALAGLASRGRPDGEAEEMQETLNKIRRRLETLLPDPAGQGRAQELAEAASGEASDAVHQVAIAVDRLNSSTREAEGRLQSLMDAAEARLQGTMDTAEMRLHAATATAAQVEQLMDLLPERLGESVQAIEARGLPAIDAAVARVEAAVSPLGDLLADYAGAVSGLTARSNEAAGHVETQVAGLGASLEKLAATLPERVAAALQPALQAALRELNNGADLLDELNCLAIGQATRLTDIIARADKVAYDLPAVAQSVEAAVTHLQRQVDHDGRMSATLNDAADGLARLTREAASAAVEVPARLAEAAGALETRLLQGSEALQTRLDAGAGVASDLLMQRLAAAAASVESRMAKATEALQARLDAGAGAIADAAATLPAIREGLRDVVVQLARDTRSQASVLAEAARSLSAESAALLEAAQSRVAGNDDMAARAALSMDAAQEFGARVGGLTARLETLLADAEAARAQAEASAHAQAQEMRAREADQVAAVLDALSGRAETCLGALPAEAAALAAAAAQVRGDAERLAGIAAQIAEAASAPDALSADPGGVLTALLAGCQRLENNLVLLGEAGMALTGEISDIDRQTRQIRDEAAAAQAGIAASAREGEAAIRTAAATLTEVMARLQASTAGDAVASTVQSRLAMLADQLADWLKRSEPSAAMWSERITALLDRNEQLAGRLAVAADAVAGAGVGQPHLAEATASVHRAAADVAHLAIRDPCPAEGLALAGLNGLASLAETLHGQAESLAASALRGETVDLPAELVSQTPVMLAAIETSIHRLRGTATALALASDARRKAA